jgi:hypothetical protein
VDDVDFKSVETALTIANTDIKLIVNGGASANKNSGGGTHRVNGVYGVTFDATDTATVGEMEVSVSVSGALVVFDKFFVVEEAVYDALFVAAAPGYVVDQPVNVTKVGGTTQTAGDIMADTNDIQSRLPAALVSGRMDASVGAMAANVLTAAAIAADAITDAKVAADVTIASVTGAVGSVTAGVTVTTNNDKTGYGLSAAAVQAIWDALTSALTTVGSIGKLLVDNVNATISSRLATAGYTAPDNTGIAAIKTKTDQLVFTIANKLDASIQAAGDFAQAAADKVWLTAARLLTAGTNIVLAKGVGVTGFNDLDAAGVRTAVGLAAANLDTQLAALDVDILTRLATSGYTAPPTAAQNADKLLGRNLAGGADGTRTVQDALRLLRNKSSVAAGTLTVTQEDDLTPAWTAAVVTTAGNPISSIDPA